MTALLVGARVLLAGVLVAAGLSKARSRSTQRAFVASLAGFGITGRAAAVLGPGVAAAEVATSGLLLLPGLGVLVGAFAAFVLTLTFTFVVVRATSGPEAPACNCFGASGDPLRRDHAWRNLALTLVAGALSVAALAGADRWLPAGAGVGSAAVLPALFAAAVAAGLALVAIRWDDLHFLLTSPS